MPRTCVTLTPEDAKLAPREYALLKQLEAGSDGSIDAQVWASASAPVNRGRPCFYLARQQNAQLSGMSGCKDFDFIYFKPSLLWKCCCTILDAKRRQPCCCRLWPCFPLLLLLNLP